MTLAPESDRHTLLERAEEVAQAGSWEWDLDTDRLLWSNNLFRIFGLEPGEITPTPAYVAERTHPDDRDVVERVLADARREGQLGPLEYRIVRNDGAVRHLRALQAVVDQSGGRLRRLVGSVQDLTDWRRAERQIAAHVAVSESLARWETFDEGIADLLRNLAEALDAVAGALWVPRGEVLVPATFWHSRITNATNLQSEIRDRRLARGVGLAGMTWQSGEPGAGADPAVGHGSAADRHGAAADDLRSRVAIPARHQDEVLAVFEFFSDSASSDLSDRLMRSLTGIGYELGQFLSRHRGELSPRMLSRRELQVLELASQGRTAREIADLLFLSPATVSTHLSNVYEKYGVSDRASAVAKALREGLIE